MRRVIVSTEQAPRAIGPYSQAVQSGDLLFLSGQIALDPATGQLVGDGDVRRETEQVLANAAAVLRAGGASFGEVAKATWPRLNPASMAVPRPGTPPPGPLPSSSTSNRSAGPSTWVTRMMTDSARP